MERAGRQTRETLCIRRSTSSRGLLVGLRTGGAGVFEGVESPAGTLTSMGLPTDLRQIGFIGRSEGRVESSRGGKGERAEGGRATRRDASGNDRFDDHQFDDRSNNYTTMTSRCE